MPRPNTPAGHPPAKELIAAVINQARADAGPKEIEPYTSYQEYGEEIDFTDSARHFLNSHDRDAWFEMLDIEAPWGYDEGDHQEYVKEATR